MLCCFCCLIPFMCGRPTHRTRRAPCPINRPVSQLCSSFLLHFLMKLNRSVFNRYLPCVHGVDGNDNFAFSFFLIRSRNSPNIARTTSVLREASFEEPQPQETKQVWRWSHFILTGTKLRRDMAKGVDVEDTVCGNKHIFRGETDPVICGLKFMPQTLQINCAMQIFSNVLLI